MPSSFWQGVVPHPQHHAAGVNDAVTSNGRKITPFCNGRESSPSTRQSKSLGFIPRQMTQIDRPPQWFWIPSATRAT